MKISFFEEPFERLRWSPTKDYNKFLGGTQEWLCDLSSALARRGHIVSVYQFNRGESYERWRGVSFLDREKFKGDCDVAVSWNNRFSIPNNIKAKKKIYFTIGLEQWMKEVKFNLDGIDWMVALSDYQKDSIQKRVLKYSTKSHDDVFKVISIGAGLDRSQFPRRGVRDENLCLYSSSWDRGLVRLMACWPFLKRSFPELKLIVTYSNDWTNRLVGIDHKVPKEWRSLPGVEFKTPSREEMGRLYKQASYLLYPCTGSENFCLTAWKAQFAGCYPVTTNRMALVETVRWGSLSKRIEDWVWDAKKSIEKKAFKEKIDLNFPTWDAISRAWESLA